MNYSSIALRTENRIGYLTLNRPERRNALDDTVMREMSEALTLLNRDSGVRVVVISGEGEAFCAGMDLEYLRKYAGLGEHENIQDANNFLNLLRSINGLKKPVIAMVNGPALGGGCGLVAACDFVFASAESSRLGSPEVRIGFLPAIIIVFLIKRMGEGAAREMVPS